MTNLSEITEYRAYRNYFDDSDWSNALNQLDEILSKYENLAVEHKCYVHVLRGKCFLEQNDFRNFFGAFEAATIIDPNSHMTKFIFLELIQKFSPHFCSELSRMIAIYLRLNEFDETEDDFSSTTYEQMFLRLSVNNT